jgi:hypothetical protein
MLDREERSRMQFGRPLHWWAAIAKVGSDLVAYLGAPINLATPTTSTSKVAILILSTSMTCDLDIICVV